jgi:hypothetical protein
MEANVTKVRKRREPDPARKRREPDRQFSYWEKRKNSIYLRYVDYITCALSNETRSLIDVGSRSCPYLDWFPWVEDRVSLDLTHPYHGPGVRSITADFLTWEPDRRYDVVLCLQVLEHIRPVKDFAAKLLEIGNHVIVSVPYRWPKDALQGHVHDPINRRKFESWFPRQPDYFFVVREPLSRRDSGSRIVAYFDTVNPGSGAIYRKRPFARRILAGREPVTFTA